MVVTRLHVSPILNSRSKCLSCGEVLRALDLIPLFSYIFLKGKCRYCKSIFGKENLYVEVIYGSVYVLLYHFILLGQVTTILTVFWFIFYSLLFIVLGVIALYDLKHTYIPVPYLISYCVFTIIMLGIRYMHYSTSMILLAPLIVALPFLGLWIISKGKWLGFGDVILFFGVGAFFGIEQGLAVLLISIWMGAIVGVGLYLLHYKKIIKNIAIPFVPFIVFAFVIVLFTDIDVFSIAELFA